MLHRSLLAGIAWLAFAFGNARAASITETVPFTILAPSARSMPAQTINVSTPQFNPLLGTLESANTTIAGTVSAALEFFSTGPGGPYDILLSDTLSLAGIPALFGQELTGAVPPDQAAFAIPVTFAFGPVDRSDPAGLVTGSGTWNQLFSLPSPSLAIKQSPASVLVPGMSISGSSVTTYTYIPALAAAPEPRSFWLLATLLGIGIQRLRARPPVPPFTRESAIQKVRLAEDAWNTRNPEKVALAYTIDSRWRNHHWLPGRRPDDHPELSEFGL